MEKIQVIGNIGQDAKINEFNGSKAIGFTIAVNRKYVYKDGVPVEQTNWYSCTKWVGEHGSAEIAKYLKAGTKMCVEGIPRVSTYVNKKNITVANQNLDVRQIELLSAKKDSETQNATQQESTETLAPNQNFDKESDDLPF